MKKAIEHWFRFAERGTSLRTETIAGVTTFMTMAYILFVNPTILAQSGMDFGAAAMATILSAGIATVLMGLMADYPIALAPGMGINAFFTYTLVLSMGLTWQTALGCTFIEGVIFLLLTFTGVRQTLVNAIPSGLRNGIACGIGLFIAFVGLKDSGIVAAHPATIVTLGDVTAPPALLSLFGLFLTAVLLIRRVPGSLLWGILATAAAGIPAGIVRFQGLVSPPPSLAPTFLQLDIAGALEVGLISIIFVLLFVDIFDTTGTLAGTAELGGFMRDGKLPRAGKAMAADAVGTCAGAMLGTSTVTSYIESAAGIAVGGRTGFANVVTGALFLATAFFSPLVRMVGGGYPAGDGSLLYPVTAPALIIVGSMMLSTISRIRWDDFSESVPAFLVIILIPLSFSIATGIAAGFIAYAGLKLFSGRGREVHWMVYLFAVLFILRFAYLRTM